MEVQQWRLTSEETSKELEMLILVLRFRMHTVLTAEAEHLILQDPILPTLKSGEEVFVQGQKPLHNFFSNICNSFVTVINIQCLSALKQCKISK